MKLRYHLLNSKVCYLATAFLVTAGLSSAYAQQGIATDWSSRHVIFSSPGTEMNALMNGKRAEWQHTASSYRYQVQQIKRSAAWANRFSASNSGFSETRDRRNPGSGSSGGAWTEPLGNPLFHPNSSTAFGMGPAKFSFSISTASCSDFVVFPINAPGHFTGTHLQANIEAFNNLYDGTCAGSSKSPFKPSVMFSYYVGTGVLQTSAAFSEDGTKLVFVESILGGSKLHVLTIGTTGSNGTAENAPARPCIINGATCSGLTNNAVDTYKVMNGSASVTISSPFIDYADNVPADAVAYVGDDNGKLHKFTGLFGGTLAEVTTGGWPFTVAIGQMLTSPVFDETSKIFVGAADGNLYCILISGGTPTSCGSDNVAASAGNPILSGGATDGPILDGPIVDPTAGRVYSQAVFTTFVSATGSHGNPGTTTSREDAVLMQDSIANFTRGVRGVDMGSVQLQSAGTRGSSAPAITLNAPNLYDGDFDNTYFNSSSDNDGFMYFCGNASSKQLNLSGNVTYNAIPELYRIAINGNHTIATGTQEALYQLASSSFTVPGGGFFGGTAGAGCTPLTESFNPNQNNAGPGTTGTDYLFLGVSNHGAPSGVNANCSGLACVMSFVIGDSASSASSVSAPLSAFSLGGFNEGLGSSGIIIDNFVPGGGASQIYLGNLEDGDATQLSQTGLN